MSCSVVNQSFLVKLEGVAKVNSIFRSRSGIYFCTSRMIAGSSPRGLKLFFVPEETSKRHASGSGFLFPFFLFLRIPETRKTAFRVGKRFGFE